MLYAMYDWRNSDFHTQHPEYGPIGSHIEFTWEDVNPAPGVYDWSAYDRFLAKARGMTVEIPGIQGNTVISKPVQLTLMIYGAGATGHLRDYTPEWVYQRMGSDERAEDRLTGHALHPNGCPVRGAPAYEDSDWRQAFADMVRAFGERYDQDPQVVGIWLGVGVDDETQPTKKIGDCDYPAELGKVVTCDEYLDFIHEAMQVYAEAFPHKPLWIQAGPGACTAQDVAGWRTRKQIMEWALPLGIGYKNNGLTPDKVNAVGYGNSAGWESMDIADRLWTRVPIAFEPAFTAPVGESTSSGDAPVEYAYWMIHNALAHHADFIDVQPQWLDALAKIPGMFDYIQRSLGVTMQLPKSAEGQPRHIARRVATDVWIVMRDAEYAPLHFKQTGMSGDPGDWEFFLYRREGISGQTVHLTRQDLPQEAWDQPYSRHARRTDQAHDGTLIPLDVDDRWLYAGPQRVPMRYLVRVWYLDQGNDRWAFEYTNALGEIRQRVVKKRGTNRWRMAEWTLEDMALINAMPIAEGIPSAMGVPGRVDVRLNSMGDGDDTFHKVLIRALPQIVPTATPVVAKVEIVWPHGSLPVDQATLANITAYIFTDDQMSPPPCDWNPTVRLWVGENNQPVRPLMEGQRRLFTLNGRTFPVWDFNDVDVSIARLPKNKLYFFATVDGIPTRHNIWAHAADGRTFAPNVKRPTGVVVARPDAIDAHIQIVWPHDNAPVTEAKLVNITVLPTKQGTWLAIPPDLGWRPALRLHWSVNAEAEPDFDHTLVGTPRVVNDNGLSYLVWDFNDVDVSLARDPKNRYYFWVTADDIPVTSNVWAHGADARTYFPQMDVPSRSCR
ncbi:MAG: hypothetical protein J7M34_05525 [Anaerolineae bacterium]|nr:hypothetical protein [Anaerolineae bacterium]